MEERDSVSDIGLPKRSDCKVGDDSTELCATESTRKIGNSSKSRDVILDAEGEGDGGVKVSSAKNHDGEEGTLK
jgi:hypothetical protein